MAEEVSTSYDSACDVATVEPLFFLYWIEKIEEEDTEHRIQSTEYRYNAKSIVVISFGMSLGIVYFLYSVLYILCSVFCIPSSIFLFLSTHSLAKTADTDILRTYT